MRRQIYKPAEPAQCPYENARSAPSTQSRGGDMVHGPRSMDFFAWPNRARMSREDVPERRRLFVLRCTMHDARRTTHDDESGTPTLGGRGNTRDTGEGESRKC